MEQQKLPTVEKMHAAKIDEDKFNLWMAKHLGYYRIAQRSYIRFPPHWFAEDGAMDTIEFIGLSLVDEDPVSIWRISTCTEEEFPKVMDNIMACFGNKSYAHMSRAKEVMASYIGYDLADHKNWEESKKWLELSDTIRKNQEDERKSRGSSES
jgi:hypothetical protein